MIEHALKLLVIEDNTGDFLVLEEMLVAAYLTNQHIIMQADSIKAAQAAIGIHGFDLIFLDLSLPDSNGIETYEEIERIAPDTPIIVLSGLKDSCIALQTVKHGAQDYLIKGDFDEKLLAKSIFYSIERKKSLHKLKYAKENYESLFDNNPIPMWAYHKVTWQFLFVNKAAIYSYGYSREEFLSMTIKDIRPPEDLERLYNVLNVPLKQARNDGEWNHKKKNRKIIQVEISSSNIIIDGTDARLVVAYDISERKKAQSKSLFQANILQNITDMVIVTDLMGNITYWNERAGKIFGYKETEILGKPFDLIQHPGDETPLAIIYKKLFKEGEFNTRTRKITRQGKALWIDIKATAVRDDEQNVSGLLFILKDVTKKKSIKETLHIQKKTIESVGIGIIITDPNQTDNPIIFSNPEFCRLSGYSHEEAFGRNCRFLSGEKTEPKTQALISEALAGHKSFSGEILNYKKNGEVFWNSLMITPIFDDCGKLINFVGFQRDITEEKRDREELLYKNNELNTFIYRASHDIRSPIASMMGLAQIALMEYKNHSSEYYFSLINKTSHRLDEILRNLLNLTAIKQDNPVYEEIHLVEFVQNITKSLQGNAEYAEASITMHFDEPPVIHSDKNILKSILKHILENSLKYRRLLKESHEINIHFVKGEKKIQLKVIDNGIGIPKDSMNKVCDMFYRGTELSNGSGLGLYMVKNFVEKLHGSMEIKSEENVGTTLLVNLPKPFIEVCIDNENFSKPQLLKMASIRPLSGRKNLLKKV